METVRREEMFEVQCAFTRQSLDLAVLTDCYLPLIGPKAFSIYLSFLRMHIESHGFLFDLLGLTAGEFLLAMQSLEAIGLIRTFREKDGEGYRYVYHLAPALAHGPFFDDLLLAGTLRGKIGEAAFERIRSRLDIDSSPQGMEETTASFRDAFRIDYPADMYLEATVPYVGDVARPKVLFDEEKFLRALAGLGARKNLLSEEEIADVGKLATLYGLSEETMAELCFDSLRQGVGQGRRLDVAKLGKRCASAMPFDHLRTKEAERSGVKADTPLAKKIALMDTMPPAKYLQLLQGGHRLAEADAALLIRLNVELGLPAPCVNALIDYVLETRGNELPRALCEKIAASLVREGCKTARDAMDYLKRSHRKAKKEKPSSGGVSTSVAKPVSSPSEEEVVTDEELDALIDSLDQ